MNAHLATENFVDAMEMLICGVIQSRDVENSMLVPVWMLQHVNSLAELACYERFDWEISRKNEFQGPNVWLDYHVMQRVRRRHYSFTQRYIQWGGGHAAGIEVRPVPAAAPGPSPSFLQRLVRRWLPHWPLRDKQPR